MAFQKRGGFARGRLSPGYQRVDDIGLALEGDGKCGSEPARADNGDRGFSDFPGGYAPFLFTQRSDSRIFKRSSLVIVGHQSRIPPGQASFTRAHNQAADHVHHRLRAWN
jgi:hypothetical protein